MAVVFTAPPGRFGIGDRVVVRSDVPDHHHRAPWFVKGKPGIVRAVSGPFLNPESRAYGGDGTPKRLLYQVEFSQPQIWGSRYSENPNDTLLIDLYEQWLEPPTNN